MAHPPPPHGGPWSQPPPPGPSFGDAYPPIPPPPPLPSIGPDGRPIGSLSPLWTYAVVFLVAMSAVVSVGLLLHHLVLAPDDRDPLPTDPSSGEPAPIPTSAAPAAEGSLAAPPSAQPESAAASAQAAPVPIAPSPPAAAGSPQAEATAALEKLRDGVRTCVTTNIGVLPGTSLAIPARLSTLRGQFQAPAAVWRTPVFHCTKFKLTGPQRFQIQWQNDTATTTGRGVAWLDDDGDGKPDKSLSFPAELLRRNEVELGPVRVDDEPLPIRAR